MYTNKKTWIIAAVFAVITVITFVACSKSADTNPETTGTVKISVRNMVNGAPLTLGGPAYTNPFGETYTVSKFKYYISNVAVSFSGVSYTEKDSYHLIDQADAASQSISFAAKTGTYSNIVFTLGVDSLRNVSGAQTGALDPLKDMFWTWNSGYIMAKMEGASPLSTQPNNKVEYHIGGFSGTNNVLKTISFTLPAGKLLDVREGKISEIKIDADLNKWWQQPNDITIASTPVCTTPGTLATKIAANYSKMFTLTDVVNN
jgi:hypothetical protein